MFPETEIDTRASLHAPEAFQADEESTWERWAWRAMVALIAGFGLALLWLPVPGTN